MTKEITEGEERFVQKTLDDLCGGSEDETKWMEWILKRKRSKVEDRLVLVSRFRVVSIKRNKMGKKSIQREGHIYQITKLVVENDYSGASIHFPDFYIEVSGGDVKGMAVTLMTAYHNATGDWPESALFPVEGPSEVKSAGKQELGIAESLLGCYEAFCNLYKQPPSTDFRRHVTDTVKTGRAELDLTHCPGIEPRTEYTFDLTPALAALSYNTYFRSFRLDNIGRREAVQIFSVPLVKNTTITRVVLSGLDAGPEGFVALGDAFKRNPGNRVCELDFANNKMGDRGIAGLSSGLMTIQHGLLSFNIANNMITAKGIAALVVSLRANEAVSGTMEELNVAANKFDTLASQGFADWVTDMKESSLAKLNLCDTQIDIPTVLTGLRLGLADSLVHLDLSHNRIERQGAQSIALFLEKSQVLNFLNLAYCRLPPEAFEPILGSLKANGNLRELKLIFAGNAIGANPPKFGQGVEGLGNLHTLNLRDNGLKVDGIRAILNSVANSPGLKCLDIGLNIIDKTPNTKSLGEAIGDFLKRHRGIQTLQFTGDSAKIAYGPPIAQIFDALNESESLTELDISGNRCGDRAAVAISDALRKNTRLTFLNWDNNGIAMGGYQAFRSCLEAGNNKTLYDVPFPRFDVDRAVAGSKDAGRFRQRINELFLEINTSLKNNREAAGADTVLTNIQARKQAEYKEPPLNAPASRQVKTLRKAPAGRAKPTYTVYTGDGEEMEKQPERSPRHHQAPLAGSRTPRIDDDDIPPPMPSPRSMNSAPSSVYNVPPPVMAPPPSTPASDWGSRTHSPGSAGRGAGTARPPVFSPPAGGRGSGVGGSPSPPVFNGAQSVGGRGRGGPLRPPAGPPPTPAPPTASPPAPTPPFSNGGPPVPPSNGPPVAPRRQPPPTPPSRTPAQSLGYATTFDDEDDDAPPPPPREDFDDDEMYNYG
eukprot:TRINITY_DN10200_c0_g1_i1.p1 TRINITY_DN10200_c0_g1~~TRINITY_DN10200_c0_g1_i1.p1  ORF type:complete len:936 (+),score=135.81 TRINITY_DN10200_c0_g1_i1:260-3067(+)